jgi:hypothetical protein
MKISLRRNDFDNCLLKSDFCSAVSDTSLKVFDGTAVKPKKPMRINKCFAVEHYLNHRPKQNLATHVQA